ncbi:hypothetical protein MTR_7g095010 [Medicago truncatula]|uniref:Uncharacterized protein n=1 Tax=Medicago truncatula TaxID=3880 RepID=A0A072U335_MEDTR|nr:hypothetical protein MTR_7g095010 [Medicago truncatula]
MAEVETDAEAEKKEETLKELKRHVKDLHEEDVSLKRREAATTMRMLAKENFGLKASLSTKQVQNFYYITFSN